MSVTTHSVFKTGNREALTWANAAWARLVAVDLPQVDFHEGWAPAAYSPPVGSDAMDMVSIPRAELDAMRAELRRLRREVGDGVALARMAADPGPGPGGTARVFTREQLADAWGIAA